MICRNVASSPAPAPSPVSPSQRAGARPELGCWARGAGGALGASRAVAAPKWAAEFGLQTASGLLWFGSADPGHCPFFRDPPLRSHKALQVRPGSHPTPSPPPVPANSACPHQAKLWLEIPRLFPTSPRKRKSRAPHTGFCIPKHPAGRESIWGNNLGKGLNESRPFPSPQLRVAACRPPAFREKTEP